MDGTPAGIDDLEKLCRLGISRTHSADSVYTLDGEISEELEK